MGYYPSVIARNLANNTTETIAVILPQTSGPFFSELIRGAESISRTRNYHLLIYTSCNLDDEDALLSLLPNRIDGIIWGSLSSTGQYIKQLFKRGFPFVLLGTMVSELDINTIRPNNQVGAYDLIQHLIKQHSYKRIAFISGPEDQSHSFERFLGYQQALHAHNIPIRGEWIAPGNSDENSGYECTMKLLSLPNPPDAIFASNDMMAIGSLAAARDMAYSVPNDIAIVGFDNISSAQYLQPTLTTVSVETFEQVRKAVDLLLNCIANPDTPHQDIIMPAPVILRRSCGCWG